ncbi:hypothetical protein Tco_0557684, partial [Tanacetum coccineum]
NNINTASDGNNTNNVNVVSSTVNAAGIVDNAVAENIVYGCADDPNMPNMEENVYSDDDDKDVNAEVDITNTKSGFGHTCYFLNDHTVRYLCD